MKPIGLKRIAMVVGGCVAVCLGWGHAGVGQPFGVGDVGTERARAFVLLLAEEKFDEAVAQMDQAMREAFAGGVLEKTWRGVLQQVGAFEAVQSIVPQKVAGQNVYDVHARFARFPLIVRVVLDEQQRVSGLWFRPGQPPEYRAPAYVKRERFEEVEITVGQAPWALPGTLSIPKGRGPHPAVVLVHGSGPNDRDETVGPNRVFKDLAWGLASRGIAVLRYDKRTYVYPQQVAEQLPNLTVEQEVIEDALLALQAVRQNASIDPKRVYLLGHSLGGMLAPEIAVRDGRVAGVVLLAAPARPFDEVLLGQLRHVASVDPNQAQATALAIEQLEAFRAGTLSEGDNILGMRPNYLRDLMGRDPLSFVKQLNVPLFVAQGGRDYQVTIEDFALWEAALRGRKDVALMPYPNLNHLFITGEGTATPQEYLQPGQVDAQLIEDLASFVYPDDHPPQDGAWGLTKWLFVGLAAVLAAAAIAML